MTTDEVVQAVAKRLKHYVEVRNRRDSAECQASYDGTTSSVSATQFRSDARPGESASAAKSLHERTVRHLLRSTHARKILVYLEQKPKLTAREQQIYTILSQRLEKREATQQHQQQTTVALEEFSRKSISPKKGSAQWCTTRIPAIDQETGDVHLVDAERFVGNKAARFVVTTMAPYNDISSNPHKMEKTARRPSLSALEGIPSVTDATFRRSQLKKTVSLRYATDFSPRHHFRSPQLKQYSVDYCPDCPPAALEADFVVETPKPSTYPSSPKKSFRDTSAQTDIVYEDIEAEDWCQEEFEDEEQSKEEEEQSGSELPPRAIQPAHHFEVEDEECVLQRDSQKEYRRRHSITSDPESGIHVSRHSSFSHKLSSSVTRMDQPSPRKQHLGHLSTDTAFSDAGSASEREDSGDDESTSSFSYDNVHESLGGNESDSEGSLESEADATVRRRKQWAKSKRDPSLPLDPGLFYRAGNRGLGRHSLDSSEESAACSFEYYEHRAMQQVKRTARVVSRSTLRCLTDEDKEQMRIYELRGSLRKLKLMGQTVSHPGTESCSQCYTLAAPDDYSIGSSADDDDSNGGERHHESCCGDEDSDTQSGDDDDDDNECSSCQGSSLGSGEGAEGGSAECSKSERESGRKRYPTPVDEVTASSHDDSPKHKRRPAGSESAEASDERTESEDTSTTSPRRRQFRSSSRPFLAPPIQNPGDIMHKGKPIPDDLEDGFCRMSEEEFVATLSIHEAARKGDLHVVKLLLKSDPKRMETVDERGWTPIHLASANGHPEVVRFLALEGAHLAALDPSGYTATHIAAMNGQHECLEVLLEMGADVGFVTSDGFTPLHLAALNGHVECCKILLSWGSNIQKEDALGRTVFDMVEEYSLDEVRVVLENYQRHIESFQSVLKMISEKAVEEGTTPKIPKNMWDIINSMTVEEND